MVFQSVYLLSVSIIIALLGTPVFGQVPQLSLTLDPQPVSLGSSIVVPVAISTQANPVTAIQFDLQYDDSAMSVVGILGDSARTSGKGIYINDLSGGKIRFLVVGLNQNQIPDGEVVRMFVNLKPNASPAMYALSFSGLASADPNGGSLPVTSIDAAITVQADPSASPLTSQGVVNAASLISGPVAPGEVVNLIGSGLGAASGVSFNGVSAPMLSATGDQIRTVIPYEVSGAANALAGIETPGQPPIQASIPVNIAAPGLFTVDRTGIGQAELLNEDGSPNSTLAPAKRGSLVILFGTGAGVIDPSSVDGSAPPWALPKPALPITAQIGGINAEVLYGDTTPSLISGVLQVKCRVPADVTPGPFVPVTIQIGSYASQSGVTLAVQ